MPSFRSTYQWLRKPNSVLNPASVSWMLSLITCPPSALDRRTPGYHQGKPQALAARGEGNPEVTVHAPVTCRSSLHSICQAFHDLSTPQTSSARQATFPAFKIASSFRSSFSLSKSSPYLLPAPPEPTSRNCLLLARLSRGPSASFFRWRPWETRRKAQVVGGQGRQEEALPQ